MPSFLVVPTGKGPFAAVVWGHWYWDNSPMRNRTQFLDEAVVLAQAGVVSLLMFLLFAAMPTLATLTIRDSGHPCRFKVRRAIAGSKSRSSGSIGAGKGVVEILSKSSYRMHQLTPFAQVEGLQITYPPEQATLL